MSRRREAKGSEKPRHIFSSVVNSFHALYGDAEYFHGIAAHPSMAGRFEAVRLSRTAVLLYVFSLEALANRAIDHFLPTRLRRAFLDRLRAFSLEEKLFFLPLLAGDKEPDKQLSPWPQLAELLQVRNDLVHPKNHRTVFYEQVGPTELTRLDPGAIPRGLRATRSDLEYPHSRLPKDPYGFRPTHLDVVKKTVDDIVAELDRLLDGRLTHDGWLRGDKLVLVFPQGADLLEAMPELRKLSLKR